MGICNCSVAAVDAHFFKFVVGIVYTCGINKAVAYAINSRGSFNSVTCGASDIGYHSSILLNKGVKKRTLTNIRFADNSHINTIFKCLT